MILTHGTRQNQLRLKMNHLSITTGRLLKANFIRNIVIQCQISFAKMTQWKYVVPQKDRPRIIIEAHYDPKLAHLGIDRTYAHITHNCFWPKMCTNVTYYAQHCDTCQKVKVEQRKPIELKSNRIIEHL